MMVSLVGSVLMTSLFVCFFVVGRRRVAAAINVCHQLFQVSTDASRAREKYALSSTQHPPSN